MGEQDYGIFRKSNTGVFFSRAMTVSAGSFQVAGERAALRMLEMGMPLQDGDQILVQATGGNTWLMCAKVPAVVLERV